MKHTMKLTILKPMQISLRTSFLEVYWMSDSEEKAKQEHTYEVKGIPVHAYLIDTGEFR